MSPTLAEGKIVIGVRPRKLQRGDIVIARHQGLDKIKRIHDLGAGKVFLAGDNPQRSTDSRDFGWVDAGVIIAKVIWIQHKF